MVNGSKVKKPFIKGGIDMFKKTSILMVILVVVSVAAGCNKSNPAGPSGPNPAPGFEISNLRYVVTSPYQGQVGPKTVSIKDITVDYKGAQGGIKSFKISNTVSSDSSYKDAFGGFTGGSGTSGTVKANTQ